MKFLIRSVFFSLFKKKLGYKKCYSKFDFSPNIFFAFNV